MYGKNEKKAEINRFFFLKISSYEKRIYQISANLSTNIPYGIIIIIIHFRNY